MSGNSADFSGNIPENYDSGMGPVIFAGYATDMARRVASGSPTRVLETAAGTGIVTRALRDAISPETHLTATDLNVGMGDIARTKFRSDEQMVFQEADATALPFPGASFDAVVCQFGVMFFPDKEQSYREIHRVLVPGGKYLFSVWDSHRYNAFGRIAHEVIGSFFPSDPPKFYDVPFSYYKIDPIKEALIASGFGDIVVSVIQLQRSVNDFSNFARGIVFGNPVIDQIRQRGGVEPAKIQQAVASTMRVEFGIEPSVMPIQAIVFEARRE
jgi:ubiquinone/menaquinone biosynthesis C-methylase UbiE